MIELFEDFCVYLKTKKKMSENTLSSYRRDIKNFIIFLQSINVYAIDKVDAQIISQYISYLKKHKKSCATISRNLSSMRCFFKYLIMKKVITFNPTTGIKNEKSTSSLPEIMSSQDVDTLLSSPDTTTVLGMRDKAMLELLYATGIRVSELLNITVFDINLDVGYVNVKNSSTKERIVPLYPMAVEALRCYLNLSRDKLVDGKSGSDILFLNSTGSQMTRQGFWKIIKQYARLTKINADITPKILRHSFATHLLENGADINVIKDMLGHTAISSTKVYTKVIKNKYMNVYANCHPRAKHMQ